MDYIIGVSAFSIAALLVWVFICNLQTHRDITALLDRVSDLARQRIREGRPWADVYALYDSVSYFEFLFALMLFRDPIKLYPRELINALSK